MKLFAHVCTTAIQLLMSLLHKKGSGVPLDALTSSSVSDLRTFGCVLFTVCLIHHTGVPSWGA